MTRVKICGLQSVDDVAAVNRAMPDYAGFVFAPRSRRCLDERTARALRAALDPQIRAVGVFVGQSPDFIASLCRDTIDVVQLHGDEDENCIRRVRELCGRPVIKALGVGANLPCVVPGADFLLFDALSPSRGGMGQVFDWLLLTGYAGPPFFLAGGLSPGNVEQAILTLSPFGVDVSSGVETDGAKDADKIALFVRRARAADSKIRDQL